MDEFEHIQDPELRSLYMDMHGAPASVLRRGEAMLKDADDPLAILEAMQEAGRVIVEDLDEHGDMHLPLYGDETLENWQKRKQTIDDRVTTLRSKGKTSDVFRLYRETYDAEISRAADEFMDEMDQDEKRQQDLSRQLKDAVEKDTSGFLKVLDRLNEIQVALPRFLDVLTGCVNNAILHAHNSGDDDAACEIIESYSQHAARLGLQGEFLSELVGNSIAVSQLAGDRKRQEIVLTKLLPPDIADPRLAFNLACLFAVRGDKPRVIEYAKLARGLGKPREPFFSDNDFSPFWKDEEFGKAVS